MRKIFGGAMEVDIGEEWIDCSAIRPIPDNQEVFMHPTNNLNIIIEILELSGHSLQKHFDELAELNSATTFHFDEERRFGWQEINGERVSIRLSAIQIPERNTEILITVQGTAAELIHVQVNIIDYSLFN